MGFKAGNKFWNQLKSVPEVSPTDCCYLIDGDYYQMVNTEFLDSSHMVMLADPALQSSTKLYTALNIFHYGQLQANLRNMMYFPPSSALFGDLTPPTWPRRQGFQAEIENDHLIIFAGMKLLEVHDTLVIVTRDSDVFLSCVMLAGLHPEKQVYVCDIENGVRINPMIPTYYRIDPKHVQPYIYNSFALDMLLSLTDYWAPLIPVEPPEVRAKGTEITDEIIRGENMVDLELLRPLSVDMTFPPPPSNTNYCWARGLSTAMKAQRLAEIIRDLVQKRRYKTGVTAVSTFTSQQAIKFAQTECLYTLIRGLVCVYLRFAGLSFRFTPEPCIQSFDNLGVGLVVPKTQTEQKALVAALFPESLRVIEERLFAGFNALQGDCGVFSGAQQQATNPSCWLDHRLVCKLLPLLWVEGLGLYSIDEEMPVKRQLLVLDLQESLKFDVHSSDIEICAHLVHLNREPLIHRIRKLQKLHTIL